ncbi:MAG: hypothetical protein JWM53_3353, partial [bacterium]|nr:hypothetical protein [bacterium]
VLQSTRGMLRSISLRLPEELCDRVDDYARTVQANTPACVASQVTRSAVVRDLIERALDAEKDKEPQAA